MDSRDIQEIAGENAIQVGQARDVHIEVFRQYFEPDRLASKIDLAAYRDHLWRRLETDLSFYVPLKCTSAVALLGPGLLGAGSQQEDVSDMIGRHPRVLLVAPGGFGKTASLLHTAQLSLTTETEPKPICLYAELDRFRSPKEFSPLDCLLVMIGDALYAAGACATHPALTAVQDLLRAPNCTLLLDGISDVSSSLAKDCWQGIDDIGRRFPQLRLVVTGRPQQASRLPAGWRVASLCELDDAQVGEFLSADSAGAAAAEVFDNGGDASLLRIPLFLTFAIALLRTESSGTGHYRSRCTMVAAYVQHLLEQNFADKDLHTPDGVPLEICHRALASLAAGIQSLGQSIEIGQAKSVLSTASALGVGEPVVSRFLDDLISSGLLRSDQLSIRFFHPVLQAFFYAEALGVRLRKGLPYKLPRWLKRMVDGGGNRDYFIFLARFVKETQLSLILRRILKVDPQTGFQMLDDMAFEGAHGETVAIGLAMLPRIARRAALLSRLPREPKFANVSLAIILMCICLPGDLLGISNDTISAWWVLSILGILVSCSFLVLNLIMPRRVVGFRYSGARTVEAILVGCDGARHPEMLSLLQSLVEEIGQSRMSRPVLRNIARKLVHPEVAAMQPHDPRGASPDIAIQEVAYIRSTDALTVLQRLVEPRNIYSRFAVEALLVRARIFPNERELVLNYLRRIYNDRQTHWHFWNFVRLRLLMAREGSVGFLGFLRRLGPRLAAMSLIAAVVGGLLGFAWAQVLFGSADRVVWLVLAVFHVVLPLFIYVDTRRIGARRVPQFYKDADGCAPWQYGLFAALFPPLIGIYPFYRTLIRRNAPGLDWFLLERLYQPGGSS